MIDRLSKAVRVSLGNLPSMAALLRVDHDVRSECGFDALDAAHSITKDVKALLEHLLSLLKERAALNGLRRFAGNELDLLVTHSSDDHGTQQLRRQRIDHTALDDLASDSVDEVPELVGIVGVLALESFLGGECEHVTLDGLRHVLLKDVGIELGGYGFAVFGHDLSGRSSLASSIREVCILVVALLLKAVRVSMVIRAIEH